MSAGTWRRLGDAIIACAIGVAQGGPAHAVPIIVSGHVSSQPDVAPDQRPAGACLWQVPGQMHFVNLYAVVTITVTRPGSGRYVTRLSMGYRHEVSVEIEEGESVTIHTRAIEKRLAQCAKGTTQ